MNVLIYGDDRSPALRHDVPVAMPDPIGYIEQDGRSTIVAGSLDVPRMRALGAHEVMSFEELGLAETLAAGTPLGDAFLVLVTRACRSLGVSEAIVPADFPVALADLLRAEGVAVAADGELFRMRRRSKSANELAGIRRAQRAAQAAMACVRDGLGAGETDVATLRAAAQHVFLDYGCVPHDMLVIAAGPHGADPHDQGEGVIRPGEPIVVDIFPRDMESGCWGDITRTYCVGDPPAELVAWHRVVREAQLRASEVVRPGISAAELNRVACDVIRAAGYATRLDAGAPELLTEGFIHYLGHGLGLELHEAPTLDEGSEVLVPGDVITIEPGIYRPGFGGCRIEDVLIVTEGGYELLTEFPYELEV